MAAFKGSTFKDRAETAAQAKKALLEAFKTRVPADDPAFKARQEARRAVAEAREQRAAERQRLKAEEEARTRAETEARQARRDRGRRSPRRRGRVPRRADPHGTQGGPRCALRRPQGAAGQVGRALLACSGFGRSAGPASR